MRKKLCLGCAQAMQKREDIANIRDWFEQHIPQELREDVIILA